MSELKDLTVELIADQMAFHLKVIEKSIAEGEDLVKQLKEIANGQR